LDALASFQCVQKYKESISECLLAETLKRHQRKYKTLLSDSMNDNIENESPTASLLSTLTNSDDNGGSCGFTNTSNSISLDDRIFIKYGNKFYLIDNGKHYKCSLPLNDLPHLDLDIKMETIVEPILLISPPPQQQNLADIEADTELAEKEEEEEENLNGITKAGNNSLVIENIHKRQNYIFSKHLMSVFPHKQGNSSLIHLLSNDEPNIRSIHLKQMILHQNEQDTNDNLKLISKKHLKQQQQQQHQQRQDNCINNQEYDIIEINETINNNEMKQVQITNEQLSSFSESLSINDINLLNNQLNNTSPSFELYQKYCKIQEDDPESNVILEIFNKSCKSSAQRGKNKSIC
jgi:hypothetical protein